jgi:AraC-like DNA-binding protein
MEQLPVHKSLEPFVKDIFLLENDSTDSENKLPFYADGFAGIIYSKSVNPFYLQPRNKKLSDFYLYGQTIEPISLDVIGKFKLVCMRMYPFAVRILLGVDPKKLNDDCFDLKLVENIDTLGTIKKLRQTEDENVIVELLAVYFNELLQNASTNPDYRIKLAINLILNSNGTISIKELRDKLCVTERTLERHFLKEIGITAKQFAKVIQFSSSMKQITDADYLNLSEIGYDNRFADQSHFIRSFKRFTGKTPKEFQQEISL